jgi:chemotaxis protein MotA
MRKKRMLDVASLLALPLGILIVLAAQVLEGGAPQALVQGPAALIVFGGTLAAVLISYSPIEVGRAVRAVARTFERGGDDDANVLMTKLVAIAGRAHRRGLMSLETELADIEHPLLRDGLSLIVDGTSIEVLKDMVAVERRARDADEELPARVFEAAAGYAPTLGILGAVLGLIEVMHHLSEPAALGSGIAVAFVATVYGVGGANLLFLPLAGRLRERAAAASRRRDLVSEALFAIHARTNPRLVEHKLKVLSA